MAQAKAYNSKSKSCSEKSLSTLLQEIISLSPLCCLSTCEAVRALRRTAPPTLKDTPIIRLRKKITDCLTRNPAFDIALDHLRHGIRPRYALRGTDVASGKLRPTQKRPQRALDGANNGSFAHSTTAGDRLLQEAIDGQPSTNSPSLARPRKPQQEQLGSSSGNCNTIGGTRDYVPVPVMSVYGSSNMNIKMNKTSLAVKQSSPVYTPLPRFPKVNFPDLTSMYFDPVTPPEDRSPYHAPNLDPLAVRNSFPLSDLSHMEYNQFPFPTHHLYDLSSVQCNLFPFPTPPTSPGNCMVQLPTLSPDDVFECLTFI